MTVAAKGSLLDSRPPAPLLGERFDRAVAYALATHRTHTREGSAVPYAAQLFGVCALVLERAGSEAEAIAALLRDTAEDRRGRAQPARIEERFGPDVAAVVAGCSDSYEADPAARTPFYDRKIASIEAVARDGAPGDAIRLVSAAATWYDANATYEELVAGRAVFERFDGKRFGTLWYYRAFADAALEHDGRHVAFAERLIALVDEMAGKAVTARELLAAFAIDDTVERREKGSLLDSEARR